MRSKEGVTVTRREFLKNRLLSAASIGVMAGIAGYAGVNNFRDAQEYEDRYNAEHDVPSTGEYHAAQQDIITDPNDLESQEIIDAFRGAKDATNPQYVEPVAELGLAGVLATTGVIVAFKEIRKILKDKEDQEE